MSLAKWTVGLMAGMSMLAIAAQANAGEVRVTVAEYSAKTAPYFADVKKEFEAANPGITVKFEVVPWDVLLQKLTTDITAGTNADLSIIGTRWLIDFVQQDVAEPLDSYIKPDFKDRFIDTFLSPSIMEGKTYGLPIAASARAMYYNKELFEKAGIAKPPATWTELQEDARKIKALGSGTFGFGLQGKEIETDVYYYYAMWSQGTEILNKDGTSGLSTPGALEAAKLYKSMIDEGLTEPGVTSNNREDVQNLFKQGKVGMMITAPFLSNQIKDEAPNLKYGVAAIPAGPTGARHLWSHRFHHHVQELQEQGRGLEAARFPVHHGAARQVHAGRRLPAGEQGRGENGLLRQQCRSGRVHRAAARRPLRAGHPGLGRGRPDHLRRHAEDLSRRRPRGRVEGRSRQGQCGAEKIGAVLKK